VSDDDQPKLVNIRFVGVSPAGGACSSAKIRIGPNGSYHDFLDIIAVMCGRFTQAYAWRELYELYRLTCPPVNTEPRYNIAPTTMIDVVVPHEAGRDLLSMRWGLIPSWWKKTAKEVPSTFNARVETVASR
jgi:hypothetical protein